MSKGTSEQTLRGGRNEIDAGLSEDMTGWTTDDRIKGVGLKGTRERSILPYTLKKARG